MRCDECRFFVPLNECDAAVNEDEHGSRECDIGDAGSCHRYPPRTPDAEPFPSATQHPVVWSSDWCGEFQNSGALLTPCDLDTPLDNSGIDLIECYDVQEMLKCSRKRAKDIMKRLRGFEVDKGVLVVSRAMLKLWIRKQEHGETEWTPADSGL